MTTVPTRQVHGVRASGRLHMATEATCPYCKGTATYLHIESHSSPGQWYGCIHLRAAHYDADGVIESVEFSND